MATYNVVQFHDATATGGTVDTINIVGPTSAGTTDPTPTAGGTRRLKGIVIFNKTADDLRFHYATAHTGTPTPTTPSASPVSGYHIPAGGDVELTEADGCAGAVISVKVLTVSTGRVVIEGTV